MREGSRYRVFPVFEQPITARRIHLRLEAVLPRPGRFDLFGISPDARREARELTEKIQMGVCVPNAGC